ncbi:MULTISPECIES: phosphonate C-P lyase system protein PhnG [unclassified Methylobacterium]|uniref:phosphonate C-P lyase system protein PhnG n=1 Tax=unclassified Methylobacterium TaxID=2615210 RepID=UPI00226AF291|nr:MULTISPECIES: phosphonate C-P lyase system protein PhnG [unclassified Methylobacterium]
MTPNPAGPEPGPEIVARQAVMALCADASRTELEAALTRVDVPAAEDLRPPETGLVMATGRIGGDGRPFHVGEVSVTRAAIRLADGGTGFAYHLGRDRTKARLAAILDALWQDPAQRAHVEAALADAADRAEADRWKAARQTAATRVEFLTVARGED